MTTIETPFLAFWRALDAELAKLGETPATQGEAKICWEARTLPKKGAGLIEHARQFPGYAPPPHQRGSGKEFTA